MVGALPLVRWDQGQKGTILKPMPTNKEDLKVNIDTTHFCSEWNTNAAAEDDRYNSRSSCSYVINFVECPDHTVSN